MEDMFKRTTSINAPHHKHCHVSAAICRVPNMRTIQFCEMGHRNGRKMTTITNITKNKSVRAVRRHLHSRKNSVFVSFFTLSYIKDTIKVGRYTYDTLLSSGELTLSIRTIKYSTSPHTNKVVKSCAFRCKMDLHW
jgi:hypothetical protein